jgi:hypothetical protein
MWTIHQIYGPQIAKPEIATFAEGPQIFFKIEVRKVADFRFAELICGPPTFGNIVTMNENYCCLSYFLHCAILRTAFYVTTVYVDLSGFVIVATLCTFVCWQSQLKGHGNEPNFPRFLHKSLWPRSLTQLHYISSRSDFGFEFAEIFVFEKRLPVSVSRGVDKIASSIHFFQTFK